MSIPPINVIFDIDEELKETEVVDIDINDDDIDQILNATDGTGYTWEQVKDDDNEERVKTYSLSIDEYENWIKNLEKAGLSYVKHDHRYQLGGRKKYKWTERWFCHRYGSYKSVA